MMKVIPIVLSILLLIGVGVYVVVNQSGRISTTFSKGQITQNGIQNSAGPTPVISITKKTESINTVPTIDTKNNQITLKITFPANNAIVTAPDIIIKGITTPGAEVAVNDKETIAGSDGRFSVTITLDEGDNYISAVATNSDGQAAEIEMNITLNTGN
jgi:hypothetical protein